MVASFYDCRQLLHFLLAQSHRVLLFLSAHAIPLFLGVYFTFSYLLDGLLALDYIQVVVFREGGIIQVQNFPQNSVRVLPQ